MQTKRAMKQSVAVGLINGLSSAFLLAVFLSFILVSLNTGKLNQANQDRYDLTYNANRFMNGSAYLTNEVRAYAATGKKVHYDNYWNEINVLKNRDIGVQNLQEIGITREEQGIIDAMSALSNELVPLESAAMENVEAGRTSEAIDYVYGDQYSSEIAEINKYKEQFLSMLDERSAAAIKSLKAVNRTLICISFCLIVVVVVIQGCSYLYLKKQLIHPLLKIKGQMEEIADGRLKGHFSLQEDSSELGMLIAAIKATKSQLNDYISDITVQLNAMADNDMSKSIDMDYIGDFEPIKSAMGHILDSLNDVLSKVNRSSREVASGANQVSSGSQALAQGSTQQSASVEQMSGNLREMERQIQLTAEEAKQAREKAAQMGQEMQLGNSQMEQMLAAMDAIGEASSQISGIIKTIEDIAFQTNILALNAAVEAARAGAAGKGFSVVADEVRNLAGKSAEASHDTSALIEKSMDAVRNGSEVAMGTAKTLQSTAESATQLTQVIQRIYEVSQAQASSVEVVMGGMDQISQVVQSNSATAEESAAASEELASQAADLEGLVERFKLRD